MGQSQQGKDMNTNSSNSLQVVSQSLLLWHGQLILLLWHQHPSWAPVWVLVAPLLTLLPAYAMGIQQRMAQVLGSQYSHRRPGGDWWLLASTQLSISHCGHLGSEPVYVRCFCGLSSLSISNKIFFLKKKQHHICELSKILCRPRSGLSEPFFNEWGHHFRARCSRFTCQGQKFLY